SVIRSPQYVVIAGTRREYIGVRIEKTLGMRLFSPQALKKLFVGHAVERLPDIGIGAQGIADLTVCPPFDKGQSRKRHVALRHTLKKLPCGIALFGFVGTRLDLPVEF